MPQPGDEKYYTTGSISTTLTISEKRQSLSIIVPCRSGF